MASEKSNNEKSLPFDEAIRSYLDKWEVVRSEEGKDLSPEELCPEGPESLWTELSDAIACLKNFPELPELPVGSTEKQDEESFAADQYKGVEIIGEGGQGRIIKAVDEFLQREVAVKCLKPHWIWKSEAKQRLEQEAFIMGKLEHPGVMPVYSLGFDNQDQPYYAMRYVRNEKTLANAIERHHSITDREERNKNLRILVRRLVSVCHTIAYAHDQQVIHQDLKPQNILLGDHEEVLVLDWGLSRLLETTHTPTAKTEDAGSMAYVQNESQLRSHQGTLEYMSPEQSVPGETVGTASDIFCLGATLYHLINGAPPYRGDSLSEILVMVRNCKVPNLQESKKDIPAQLKAICAKAMSKEQTDRYANAIEFADDLTRWLEGEPVSVHPESWYEKSLRWTTKHRSLVTSTVAILLIAFICISLLAVVIEISRRKERDSKNKLAVASEQLEVQNKELQRPNYATQIEFVNQLRNELDWLSANRVLDSTNEELRGIEWDLLKNASQFPEKVNLPKGTVTSQTIAAALSPDTTLIARIESSVLRYPRARVSVLDLQTQKEIWSTGIQLQKTRYFGFSKDGERIDLVSESQLEPKRNLANNRNPQESNRILVSWNSKDGKPIGPFSSKPIGLGDKDYRIANLSFPSGTLGPQAILSATAQSKRLTFSITLVGEKHKQLPSILVRTKSLFDVVAISSDFKTIATAHLDSGIRLWSVPHGRPLGLIFSNCQSIEQVAFLPEDKGLIWIGQPLNGSLEKEAETGLGSVVVQKQLFDNLPVHILPFTDWPEDLEIHAMKKSIDGRYVVFVSQAGMIWVNNTQTGAGNWMPEIPQPVGDSSNTVKTEIDVTVTAQGNHFALGKYSSPNVGDSKEYSGSTKNGGVEVCGQNESTLIAGLSAPMAFSPSQAVLIGFDAQSNRFVANSIDGNGLSELKKNGLERNADSDGDQIGQASLISPRLLYVIPNQNDLVCIDHEKSGETIKILSTPPTATVRKVVRHETWKRYGKIRNVVFSPSGELAIVLFERQSVAQIFDTKTWICLSIIDAEKHSISDVAFSNDGNRIATAGKLGRVIIWDTKTGKHFRTLVDGQASTNHYWWVGFSDDNKSILAGSKRGVTKWTTTK